jgi:hypothetical protein
MERRKAAYKDNVVECVGIEDDHRRRGRRLDVRLDT